MKYLIVLLALLLLSCSPKEEFRASKKAESYNTSDIWRHSSTICAKSTLVRPKVDFLFIWDNSASTIFYMDEKLKNALKNTVNLISDRFDYHIVLAPLIDTGEIFLAAENPAGLSSYALSKLIPLDRASEKLGSLASLSSLRSGSENSFARTYSLITGLKSHNMFREQAYTIVVLMSNYDNRPFNQTGEPIIPDMAAHKANFNNLKNLLNAEQFRYISLVPHQSDCPNVANTRKNEFDKQMSNDVYLMNPTATDQQNRATKDSYDICTLDFNHLFDGINDTILETVLKHKYNFWPVKVPLGNFDPDLIKVKKSTGQVLAANDTVNGFKYIGHRTNQNIRYAPTPGEPDTGYFIELFGEGRVSFPECLIVNTQQTAEYFGYVHMNVKPVLSTLKLTIDGRDIPQSSSNGWSYEGHHPSKNIKIKSPSEPDQEGLPPMTKSGYFLKLHGSAIYTNNSEVMITYDPASQ